jgi:methylglutaconyl-CoA hydratase
MSKVIAKSFDTIRLETVAHVATVTLNRPEVRNAFHPSMIRELTEVFTELAGKPDVSVVVLRGEGKSFCSGADLGYMKSMADFSFEENRQDALELWGMFESLRNCPHPIVGRIHGHAMGGAVGLAALCDVAAAVTDTQFCFSEVRLGIAPAVISPFVLEKMSASYARRLMLTAEVFSAEQAFESGLVQFVGDEPSVDTFLNSVIRALVSNGPEAVRATKALLRQVSQTPSWSDRRDLTSRVIAERRVSAEGQEGLRGFLEKRAPSWKMVETK